MSDLNRIERMKHAMEASKIDALVLRLPENVLLLSGHWPMIAAAILVFPLEGEATCIVPECYAQEVSTSIWQMHVVYYSYGAAHSPHLAPTLTAILSQLAQGKRWRRIGYEASFEAVAPSWNSAESMVPSAETSAIYRHAFAMSELVDATSLLVAERARKTAYEIQHLHRASEISCFGLGAFASAVRVGISGVELAAEVERATMIQGTGYKGAVRVRAYAQVTTGAQETAAGHRPNVISTPRQLQDGDIAMLELGLVADGYWADRTRVHVAGSIRDEQAAIFETVCKAQQAAAAALRPGIPASEVDNIARSIIVEAGYGNCFPHITGHGLGFGYHESTPILGPKSTEILQSGMLTSVEPGIYKEGFGGIRIEDDVLVTDDGPVVLGPFRKILSGF